MNIEKYIPGYIAPTQEELLRIKKLRRAIIKTAQERPQSGDIITYLGKDFWVGPGVFPPFRDSMPLVENFVVNPGDSVLDIGTGSGVIAVFAELKGASLVVATDISQAAIGTVMKNGRLHQLENVATFCSRGFFELPRDERFDVITCNPPFTDEKPEGVTGLAIHDPNLELHHELFTTGLKHLKPNGRMYVSQANFGALEKLFTLAEAADLSIQLVGENKEEGDPRIFYAFEMTRNLT